ncbi:MAG: isoprenylcysteine carboxylmethyltransferase family protein [Acidobacteria bacterium]|nr:isoprenylcysteine carboxylmethyltransferase family protein [Acidobacteriota bacterium]
MLGSLIVIPIAVSYRLRSQSTGENLDRRQEGTFILLTLRPLGIAGMLGFIAFIVNPRWMAWSSVPLPVWLRWGGVAMGGFAGGLLIWTLQSLGKNLTDTVVTRKEHNLVTRGPYRWVRHPFYDALILIVLANSLATANWFIFLCGTLTFVLIVLRTRKEEENLLFRFGDTYREYRERTGAFLPRIKVK